MEELEVECRKVIGNTTYTFFHPIMVGDFLVHSWVQQKLSSTLESAKNAHSRDNGATYGFCIYQDGDLIDIVYDERFKTVPKPKPNGFERPDFCEFLDNLTKIRVN